MGNSEFSLKNIFNTEEEIGDITQQGYFHLLHQTQEKFNEDNFSNKSNITTSLEKKDFATTVTSSKKMDYRAVKGSTVDWYKYLYFYLYRQCDKNIPWASKVLLALDQEYFIFENKYLSLFFFQEYNIKTKPNILKQIQYLDEEAEDEKDQLNEGKPKKLCSAKNFGGSFISVNNDALLPGDPGIQYQFFRTQVKEYVFYFNKHIQEKDHPINIIATIFCDIFSSYIMDETESLRQISREKQHEGGRDCIFKKALEITKQLQKFIIKLQVILKLFYSNTLNYQCFSEEKDELVTSVTSLIFDHDLLYQALYDLYKLSESEVMFNLSDKFSALKELKPEDVNIDVRFCLNNSSLKYQKELIEQKQLLNEKKPENIPADNKELLKQIDHNIENAQYSDSFNTANEVLNMQLTIIEDHSINPGDYLSNVQNSQISLDQKSHNDDDNMIQIVGNKNEKGGLNGLSEKFSKFQIDDNTAIGYKSAIQLLNSIKHYRTPFEKMMIITKISEQITDNVNAFWRNMKNYITPQFLTIDADNLMSIFIYILIKSQLSEIAIHTRIIKQFTTSTTKLTMIGYYYTTLDAAINYVEETDKVTLLSKMKKTSSSSAYVNEMIEELF